MKDNSLEPAYIVQVHVQNGFWDNFLETTSRDEAVEVYKDLCKNYNKVYIRIILKSYTQIEVEEDSL